VHVSPQRFTAGRPAPARGDAGFDNTISTRELISDDNSTIGFGVVGSPGELVATTVLLPAAQHPKGGPRIVVLPVIVGASAITSVTCTGLGCEWHAHVE